MKAIIFAGGVGTRLWPLSRRSNPKQFEKVIGDKSTLELTLENLLSDFKVRDIYISTNKKFIPALKRNLPQIPQENLIGEPETRDVGQAVALIASLLYKKYPRTPVLILWSDHIVKNVELFKKILKKCKIYINHHHDKIIFISQKSRFASQNLGWIKIGQVN